MDEPVKSDAPDPDPDRRPGPGFVAGLTAAQIGAFVSFVPLLQIIVPLKVAGIDPAHKEVALSAILFWGAITAGFANMLAGALSDRTTLRMGRRRPWLLVGAAGSIGAYAFLAQTRTIGGVIAGVVLFQITFNLMFSPLLSLLVDRVSPQRRGLVTALLGLGYPVGSLIGAVLIGDLFREATSRFVVLGLIVFLAIVPFALRVKDPPRITPPARQAGRQFLAPRYWLSPLASADFTFAFCGRFLVQIGLSLVQGYLLFFLVEQVHWRTLFPDAPPEHGMAMLTGVSVTANIAAALAGGVLSDRLRVRRTFVIVGAVLLAAATAAFAVTESWPLLLAEYVVYGVGTGVYFAVDMAMITQLLPSQHDAGKDLGFVNLSNTVPQIIAPTVAVVFLGGGHPDFRSLFLVAAGAMVGGALLVLAIRRPI